MFSFREDLIPYRIIIVSRVFHLFRACMESFVFPIVYTRVLAQECALLLPDDQFSSGPCPPYSPSPFITITDRLPEECL